MSKHLLRSLLLPACLVAGVALAQTPRKAPPLPPPASSNEILFKALDTNGDGKISAEEAKQHMPPEDFRRYDQDGDGFLSLDEFMGVELRSPQPPKPQ